MKRCSTCRKTVEDELFVKLDKIYKTCCKCRSRTTSRAAYMRAYRLKNPDKKDKRRRDRKEYMRAYHLRKKAEKKSD